MSSPTEQARTQLFGDALACHTDMPAAYRSRAPQSESVERALAHAELVLRSLALIEDTVHEESDDKARDLGLLRVEAKLNLVLETLASILRSQRSELPLQGVIWSRHGAELVFPDRDPPAQGFLLLQPLAWVPQRLELPVRLLAAEPQAGEGTRVWLRFDPQPASLESALEKHLFRLHRRQLAARKPG